MDTPSQPPCILGVTITYCNGHGEVHQRTIYAAAEGSERVGGLVWDPSAFGTTVECEGEERIPGPGPSPLGITWAEPAPQNNGSCWWDPVNQKWVCPTDLD